jgi:hypothetical protein
MPSYIHDLQANGNGVAARARGGQPGEPAPKTTESTKTFAERVEITGSSVILLLRFFGRTEARTMKKPKPGTPLFDLLRETDGGSVEATEASGKQPEAQPAGPGRQIGKPTVSPTPATHDGARARPSAELPAPNAERLLEMDGNRFRVSLTSASAAVAIFGALFVVVGFHAWGYHRGQEIGLLAGYEAGRVSFMADAVGEIEAARRGPAATYLVGSLLEQAQSTEAGTGETNDAQSDTDAAAEQQANPVQWVRDHTYVVAQEFSASRIADVEPARKFLASGGVRTTAVELPGGGIQLITIQGYDRTDPTQRLMADRLLENVRALGRRYIAAGGGYGLEGYFKALKRDSW